MFLSKRETFVAILLLALAPALHAASPVWRVTGRGGVAYLAGSVHALRSVDYPLPPEFNRAFAASSRLAFEVDPKQMKRMVSQLENAGRYPKGDSLRNHVDPRTYQFLRRVFGLLRVPEARYTRYRPWMLSLFLQSSRRSGFSDDLGVERFLGKRARANGKTVIGLESAEDHAAVYSGMNDAQAEALLLLMFISNAESSRAQNGMLPAWRRGDAEYLSRMMHDAFRDYPAIGERMLDQRNRAWIPKIEKFIGSGKTYMVVVGAAHMGGPQGLLALLRGRGYQIEQL